MPHSVLVVDPTTTIRRRKKGVVILGTELSNHQHTHTHTYTYQRHHLLSIPPSLPLPRPPKGSRSKFSPFPRPSVPPFFLLSPSYSALFLNLVMCTLPSGPLLLFSLSFPHSIQRRSSKTLLLSSPFPSPFFSFSFTRTHPAFLVSVFPSFQPSILPRSLPPSP